MEDYNFKKIKKYSKEKVMEQMAELYRTIM